MNHLYQKLNSKMHTLAYVIIPLLLVLATFALNTGHAQAWTQYPDNSPPQCANPTAALNGWDYKKKIREVWPAFNPETVQKAMLITENWSSVPGYPTTNFYFADEIRFKQLNDGTLGITRTTNASAPNWPYRDFINTSNDSMYFHNFYLSSNPSDGSSGNYHDLGMFNGTPVTTQNDTQIVTGEPALSWTNGSIKCIAAGVNVTYDKSYTGRHYFVNAPSSGVGDGGTSSNCESEWWQIWEETSCKFNNALTSIGGALSQAGKDIANGVTTAFAWLFVPDMDALNIQFTEMQELWSEKLGFITFPIEFFGSIFTEMQSEVNYTGCTEESCIKNFGNFFGSNLSINFSQMHQVSPGLWQFVLLMLRITAIWSLMITIKWQYWRIMNKGSM